jgi:hypothetical protein
MKYRIQYNGGESPMWYRWHPLDGKRGATMTDKIEEARIFNDRAEVEKRMEGLKKRFDKLEIQPILELS